MRETESKVFVKKFFQIVISIMVNDSLYSRKSLRLSEGEVYGDSNLDSKWSWSFITSRLPLSMCNCQ